MFKSRQIEKLERILIFLMVLTIIIGQITPFVSIPKSKAQTKSVPIYEMEPNISENEDISNDPSTYNIDPAELLVCESGIYDRFNGLMDKLKTAITNALKKAINNVLSQIPILGLFFGGSGSSTSATVSAPSNTTMECQKWIQAKKATIKAKIAETTKLLLRIAARRFMDRLVSETVDWISGRTTGNPQFVTNWREFLGQVADEALGMFIENSPFSDLCEPFRAQIRLSMMLPGKPPFPTCTLSRVVSNIEAFYDNFANGGWLAFEESFYPWNNAFGAYLMAQEALNVEVAAAQEEAEKKTQSGYKPTEWCVEWKTDPATNQKKCVKKYVSIPSQTKSDIASKALTNQLDQADKYFITAEDLTNYAQMIGQALVARLLKSVKEELVGGEWYGKGLLSLPKEGNIKDDLKIRYACRNYSGTKACVYDPNGNYTSFEDCNRNCSGHSGRYSCDKEMKVCVYDENGQYTDYFACSRVCSPEETPTPTTGPSENRYSCNATEGLCELDPNGDFTSLTSCQKYCGSEPTPPPQY